MRKLFGLGRSGKTRETVKRKRAKRKTAKRSKGRKRRSSEVTRLLRRIRDPDLKMTAREAVEWYRSGQYSKQELVSYLRELVYAQEERDAEGRYA